MTVSAQLTVELDHIGAGGDGFFERQPSVFREGPRGAAMSYFFQCRPREAWACRGQGAGGKKCSKVIFFATPMSDLVTVARADLRRHSDRLQQPKMNQKFLVSFRTEQRRFRHGECFES